MTETTAWYPIGAVARKTGLSVHTLRAWERRYSVVEPQRSGGGTRLYSTGDIARLRLLKRAIDLGHSIGQIASLDMEELRGLVREDQADGSRTFDLSGTEQDRLLVEEVLKAVELMDGPRVHNLLMRAVVQLSVRDMVEKVITPVLAQAGDLWAAGTICPANEHLLTVNVRRVLSWLLESVPTDESAPSLLVTTPVGHWHDLGAQIASVMAAVAGWRVIFLGPNLPAEDIVRAVDVVNADAVMLGITMSEGNGLVAELEEVRDHLPPDVPLMIGGRGAEPFLDDIRQMDILIVEGWQEVGPTLDRLLNNTGRRVA